MRPGVPIPPALEVARDREKAVAEERQRLGRLDHFPGCTGKKPVKVDRGYHYCIQ